MSDKALYFPYIRVPDSAWFARVLLYWDEVGAIVPSEFMWNRAHLGEHMAALLRAGLVRQFAPGPYVYRAPRFTEAFLEFLNARGRHGRAAEGIRPVSKWVRIHMEKLGELPRELVSMGLARKDRDPWYEVEPETATHFMAYLACVIGQMEEDGGYAPITDQVANLDPLAPLIPSASDPLQSLRAVVLEKTLPAPVYAKPDDLARFKEMHRDQLRRFRIRVEDLATDLATIPDEGARTARINAVTAELNAEIAEIRARLRERFGSRIDLGTLCSILASAIPGIQAILTGDPFSGIAAGAGLVAAIHAGLQAGKSRREVFRKPLAYAALAQETLK